MTNDTATIDLELAEMQAGAERAARLLAAPALSRFDERAAADDAVEQAEELLAHLRRFVRVLDEAPADEEARIDVGQDVLELSDLLRDFALGTFLLGGAR